MLLKSGHNDELIYGRSAGAYTARQTKKLVL